MPKLKEPEEESKDSKKNVRDKEAQAASEARRAVGSGMLASNLDEEITNHDYGDAVGIVAIDLSPALKPKV